MTQEVTPIRTTEYMEYEYTHNGVDQMSRFYREADIPPGFEQTLMDDPAVKFVTRTVVKKDMLKG